jgi:cellulose synthase/poly-beta-1,6-N-acetylglucosamine synthase-like glycosyltransferase
MTSWLEILILACSVLLLPPFLILALEALAAVLPRRAGATARPSGVRCAVLVPAHDEESGIAATLTRVRAQLRPEDRLLVVADNCTDRTAAMARAAGAEAVERVDPTRRGKGFALDFGVRTLEADPPDVVVVIDADCLVQESAIDRLVGQVLRAGRPAQASYLLDPPAGEGIRSQLSAFAFRFKNLVRPLGLDRLGLPSLLTGTGMAFPWEVLRRAPLASGNIVEDMQLGLDLARAGHPPKFCAEARVGGLLPSGRDAARRQRTRWEHGHLRTLFAQVPWLLLSAVRQCRPDLLGLALELSVPPLSMLTLLWGAAVLLWCATRTPLPGALLASEAILAAATLLGSWFRFGRDCLPFTSLLAAPFYVLTKIPIYLAFVWKPERAWVRTTREPLTPSPDCATEDSISAPVRATAPVGAGGAASTP